jgi:hypothetical protein
MKKQGGSAGWRFLFFFLLNIPFSFKKHDSFSGQYGPKIKLFFWIWEHTQNRYSTYLLSGALPNEAPKDLA